MGGPGSSKSIVTMRWVMIGITSLLAIAFLARGQYVFAVLIGAMAVMRAVMLTRFQQRRRR